MSSYVQWAQLVMESPDSIFFFYSGRVVKKKMISCSFLFFLSPILFFQKTLPFFTLSLWGFWTPTLRLSFHATCGGSRWCRLTHSRSALQVSFDRISQKSIGWHFCWLIGWCHDQSFHPSIFQPTSVVSISFGRLRMKERP